MKHQSGAQFVCQCFREDKGWKVFVLDLDKQHIPWYIIMIPKILGQFFFFFLLLLGHIIPCWGQIGISYLDLS